MARDTQGSGAPHELTTEIQLALQHGDLALVRVYVRRLVEQGAPAERLYEATARLVPRAPSFTTLMEAPPNVVPMLRRARSVSVRRALESRV